ncbi:MAG: 30S ribosomal protein S18 [Solirubrobacterales bacterium]
MAKQRATKSTSRRRDPRKGGPGSGRRKSCYFCKEKVDRVDYRDTATLDRFTSDRGKIRPRGMTGLCRRHQTQLAEAIKRARELALIPYIAEGSGSDDRPRRGGRGRDRDRD